MFPSSFRETLHTSFLHPRRYVMRSLTCVAGHETSDGCSGSRAGVSPREEHGRGQRGLSGETWWSQAFMNAACAGARMGWLWPSLDGLSGILSAASELNCTSGSCFVLSVTRCARCRALELRPSFIASCLDAPGENYMYVHLICGPWSRHCHVVVD